MEKSIKNDYMKRLKERTKTSKIYKTYQMTGLELAEILGDKEHKSLYIKLAKENDERKLLEIAKDIASKKNIRNKGAYFMRVVTSN